VLPVFDNLECGLTNSKFIKKYYKPSGGFYMGLWNYLKEHKNFFSRKIKGVMIPPKRSVDINTIEDLKYAESIIC
jgi:CMP-N-acetylneuraminic acid synthetase